MLKVHYTTYVHDKWSMILLPQRQVTENASEGSSFCKLSFFWNSSSLYALHEFFLWLTLPHAMASLHLIKFKFAFFAAVLRAGGHEDPPCGELFWERRVWRLVARNTFRIVSKRIPSLSPPHLPAPSLIFFSSKTLLLYFFLLVSRAYILIVDLYTHLALSFSIFLCFSLSLFWQATQDKAKV